MVTVEHILKVTTAPAKRHIVRQLYDKFYLTIPKRIVTVADSLPFKAVPNKDDSKYDWFAVHVQIQSESVSQVWYDIIIQFLSPNITPSTKVRVYNNTPVFMYFLAYVYYKRNSLLFPQLYPMQVLTMPPKIRNPQQLADPDKYTYAALRLIRGRRISKNSVGRTYSTQWTTIPTPEQKYAERSRYAK